MMDACRLVIPDISLAGEIARCRLSTRGDDGMGSLRRYGNPADWFAFHALLAKKETVPEGKALSTQFVCQRERDGRIVFRSATS